MIKCIAMAQQIDAAAGADPYVCFKAVEEAKQLERDDKAMSFRRVSTTLKKRRRSQDLRGKAANGRAEGGTMKFRARRRDFATPVDIPPPRNLIPTDWVAGAKFEATRQRQQEAQREN